SDGTVLADAAKVLEKAGVWIRHSVPPHVLVVELPSSVDPRSLRFVARNYQTPVPLSVLESYGPLAVAAGIEWNRHALKESKAIGGASFAAMESLVAQESLPAPLNLNLEIMPDSVRVRWDGVPGALYYHLQSSFDSGFSTVLTETRTARR